MTLEEYKKKHPEHFFVNDYCYTIEEESMEYAKMMGNNNPLWTLVFEIEVQDNTIKFGNNLSFTDGFIQDVMSLKDHLVEEYKKRKVKFHLSQWEQKMNEKIVYKKETIKWRKKEIKRLKEEIEEQRKWIQFDQNDLNEFELELRSRDGIKDR